MSADAWLMGASAAIAGAAAATVYGAVPSQSQLFGRTVRRTAAGEQLAVTFDDGPNPAITPKLLDLLDLHRARATFFLIGRFARQCPELVREIAARGHLISNHTDTHPNLFWCSPRRIRAELQHCREAIADVTGTPPAWFRPPYGFRNPWVISTARALGMRTVMWTLIPGDWRAESARWLIRRMQPIAANAANRAAAAAEGGDVLCLHDGGHRGLNADRTCTLAALEYWFPRWRDLGLEFVTIAEAVRAPAL